MTCGGERRREEEEEEGGEGEGREEVYCMIVHAM